MRRADRLFRVVQMLRRGGVVTAAALARELEVSLRTVYRDIQDLMASGVPIEGETGVGYCLQRGFDLPPLMFDDGEIQALVLGARMVQAFADGPLAAAARNLLAKIELVVPERLRQSFARPELEVPGGIHPYLRANLEPVRRAVDERRRLGFAYADAFGDETRRTVRPLSLAFWGAKWTLGAWCELRRDFRTFRPDRMERIEVLEPFADEPDKSLAAYLRDLEQRLREHGWPDPWRERNGE
ncbi:MAG: YafY family protein [Planctomycetota bacterium]